MNAQDRIPDLLLRWEEARDSGNELSVEELCRECPELLDEVYRRIAALESIDAFVKNDANGSVNVDPASTRQETVDGLQTSEQSTLHAPVRILEAPSNSESVPGYEILEVLGRGGMGVVYKAKQIKLDRIVALKMIKAGAHADEADRARFITEAQAIARLHHPFIVQIYEVGEAGGNPFFSLEYCDGGSLEKVLAKNPLPPKEAAALVQQLAEAMQAAHTQGIIHRDLKPANVLLSVAGSNQAPLTTDNCQPTITPKITDFGLAKKLEEAGQTHTGAVMGTPSYMAPEQAQGKTKDIGPAADIYALGVILYECLTGRLPFRAATTMDTLWQVIHQDPVAPRQLQPKLPRDLDTICLKCLQKEPTKRYANASALAGDLRRFLAGEPIQARPVTAVERSWRWCKRNPTRAGLFTALAALLLIVTAAVVWYMNDRVHRQNEIQNRTSRINTALGDAIAKGEGTLQELETRLRDPVRVHVLLSAIQEWESAVDQAALVCNQAKTLAAGNEMFLKSELISRLETLTGRLKAEEQNYRLAKEIDDLRFEEVDSPSFSLSNIAQKYSAIFGRMGVDVIHDAPAVSAEKIVRSPIRASLVAALDHWAAVGNAKSVTTPIAKVFPRLLEIARRADPDPWRDHYRDLRTWKDLQALKALVKEADLAQQSPQILFCLGLRLPNDDAAALLRSALLYHPRDFWVHSLLAIKTKDPAERVAHCLAALAVRPDSRAYAHLGIALHDGKDFSGAVVAFNKATTLNPKDATSYYNLGITLHNQKDVSGAVTAFKKAISLGFEDARVYYNLGSVLRIQKDLAGAIAAYNKAVVINPKFADAYYNLGNALDSQKNLSGAIDAFKKVIELDPARANAYHNLGTALRAQNDFAGAINAYKKAINLEPNDPDTFFNLGNAFAAQKDFAAAMDAYRKVIELNPKGAMAYVSLGNIFNGQGRFGEALKEFRAAQNLGYARVAERIRSCQQLLELSTRENQPPVESLALSDFRGRLSNESSFDHLRMKAFRQGHAVRLGTGQAYLLDLEAEFDALLRVEDAVFRTLAHNDDRCPPGDRNSRLVFTPQKDDIHRVVVTSVKSGVTGPYALRVQPIFPVGKPQVLKGELTNLATGPANAWTQLLKGKSFKLHEVNLVAERPYVVELESPKFDTYLLLVDADGKKLTENDDVNPDDQTKSRIDFTPKETATYTLVVTSYNTGETGPYTLGVQGYGKERSK